MNTFKLPSGEVVEYGDQPGDLDAVMIERERRAGNRFVVQLLVAAAVLAAILITVHETGLIDFGPAVDTDQTRRAWKQNP